MSLNGKYFAETVPLSEWVGGLSDRVVTIVAGGPTAQEYPLHELVSAGRFIVAVNGVPGMLAEKRIRPDAVIITDPRLAFQVAANFPHTLGLPIAMPAKVAAFIAMRFPDELAKHRLCLIERVNQWHGVRAFKGKDLREVNIRSGSPFMFPAGREGKSIVGWSRKPELGFFSGCTVPFAALQIVVGHGARDVEIIGMDLSGQGHSYKAEKDALPSTSGQRL